MEGQPPVTLTPEKKQLLDRHMRNGLSMDIRNAYLGILGIVMEGPHELLTETDFAAVKTYHDYMRVARQPAEVAYILQHSDAERVEEYDRLVGVVNRLLIQFRSDTTKEDIRQQTIAALQALERLFDQAE